LVSCILAFLAPQEFEEIEFHRVHLKNGNFIDGRLLARTDRDLTLRVRIGEITLRNDLVEQAPDGTLRIELVRIRGIKEAPPPPPPLKPPIPPPRPAPSPRPPAPSPAPGPETAPLLPALRLIEPVALEAGLEQRILGILRRLASAEESQSQEILKELLPLGEPAALYLASAFADLPPGLRGRVGDALGQMREKGILPLMRKHLKNPDLSVRAQAASVLGLAGERGDADDLHPLLRDPEAIVRATAVTALQRLKNPASVRPLIGACADPEESVRSRAIDALLDLCRSTEQEQEIMPALREALERARGAARADLVAALGRAGGSEARPILEEHLADEDVSVRSRSVEALLGLPEAGPAILSRLESEEDEEVRQRLAFAAEKLDLRRAVPHLIRWLQGEEDRPSRQAAWRALRRLTLQNFPPEHEPWAQWWERVKPE